MGRALYKGPPMRRNLNPDPENRKQFDRVRGVTKPW